MVFALIILFLVSFWGCSDKGTVPDTSLDFQASDCLKVNGLKKSYPDSSFSYTFGDKLIVDFLVNADCLLFAPGLIMDYEISRDTIFVTVIEANPGFTDCLCPYMMHAEFNNLPGYRYFFICEFQNRIIYNELVIRDMNSIE